MILTQDLDSESNDTVSLYDPLTEGLLSVTLTMNFLTSLSISGIESMKKSLSQLDERKILQLMTALSKINHPATYSDEILRVIRIILDKRVADPAAQIGRKAKILDPFAGTGRVHQLRPPYFTYGVEIEKEWADLRVGTLHGDSRDLVNLLSGSGILPFDAVVTSPTYANRMADSHTVSACLSCRGEGKIFSLGVDPSYLGPLLSTIKVECPDCEGTGKADNSKRITYTHVLGHKLAEGNSGGMQWGIEYRKLHIQVWEQCYDILRKSGYLILNIKDHIRNFKAQRVPEWHRRILEEIGFGLVDWYKVAAPSMKYGKNSELRFDYEHIFVFRKLDTAQPSFPVLPRYPNSPNNPLYGTDYINPFKEPA